MEDLIGCLVGIPAMLVGAVWVWNYRFAEDEKPYLLITKQFAVVAPMNNERFERFQKAFETAQNCPQLAQEMFIEHRGVNYSFAPQNVVFFGELKGEAYDLLAQHKGIVLINSF